MAASDPDCQGAVMRPIAGIMAQPDDDRARRLAEQLRENLRKRKAQARGQAAKEDEASPPADQNRSR
jgi:hypothetical protein